MELKYCSGETVLIPCVVDNIIVNSKGEVHYILKLPEDTYTMANRSKLSAPETDIYGSKTIIDKRGIELKTQ